MGPRVGSTTLPRSTLVVYTVVVPNGEHCGITSLCRAFSSAAYHMSYQVCRPSGKRELCQYTALCAYTKVGLAPAQYSR